MKFFIWLIILIGTFYYEPEWSLFVWMGGIIYFFIYLLIGGPEQFELQKGTWIKSVSQENGLTIITITDGENDSIQQYTSNKVSVTGNIISIG